MFLKSSKTIWRSVFLKSNIAVVAEVAGKFQTNSVAERSEHGSKTTEAGIVRGLQGKVVELSPLLLEDLKM